MKIFFMVICLCCVLGNLNAQKTLKGHYVEASTHIGSILKHRSFFRINTGALPPTYGAELSWEFNTYGKRYWHTLAGFPRMGVALSYQNFRDKRLGWAIGIMPHISMNLFRYQQFSVFGRLGIGLGYVSNHFDYYYNPDNNIIGSHFNNNTGIRLGVNYNLSKHISLRPTFSFTHYSNAATQHPNVGINVTSFHVGLLYKPQPLKAEDYQHQHDFPEEKSKKVSWGASFAMGFNEIARTSRGPKFLVLVASWEGGIYLAKNNRFKLGLVYEHHPSRKAFLVNNGAVSVSKANWAAKRLMFYFSDEILMGHLGLSLDLGYYIYNAPLKFPFTRLGVRYYPFDPLKHKIAPYLGIRLKTHNVAAEFFDIAVGCSFH